MKDSVLLNEGKFQLKDGTEAQGRVLKCDSSGISTWAPTAFTQADSATIYALSPIGGTTYYCTDCSGNGATGRVVSFIGSLWRRLSFN